MKSLIPLAACILAPVLLFGSSDSRADEKKAEACIRAKVWEGYEDGWGMRDASTTTLQEGKVKSFRVHLFAGNEYQVRACADERAANVTLAIYDLENGQTDSAGNPVPLQQDGTFDREPGITFRAERSTTYHVVVKIADYAEGQNEASVSLAVLYR